jgi:hypothetical protein
MTDLELAVKYKPYIWFDKKDPFDITGVAYTIFRQDHQSMSFPKRTITADWSCIDCVIEYAIWFDYDIQHLYELEHLWIYVDKAGVVKDAEGSFHGKYLRMVLPDTQKVRLEEDTHLVVYSQPGKHAFLPEAKLFYLVTDLFSCCNETAGIDGIAVPTLYQDMRYQKEALQKEVMQYIKHKFGFMPSMDFIKKIWEDSVFMSWEQLSESIPNRINSQIDKMIAGKVE